MVELRHWLQTFGGLTLGGLIGIGFGALVYLFLRGHFQGVNPYGVIGLGGAIGTGVHGVVQRAGGFFAFFEQLFELGELVKRGIIKKEKYQEIVDELVRRRFLGK